MPLHSSPTMRFGFHTEMSDSPSALAPDYYASFHCIGPECEDTCCGGWAITIDRDIYHEYKNQKNPELAPLFQTAVQKNPACREARSQEYGVFILTSDNLCPFLDEDKLCKIHKLLGEAALCDTCAIFPRQVNRFGHQAEYSLTLSCPEAARVALLRPEPIAFAMQDPAPELVRRNLTSRRFPPSGGLPPEPMQIWSDLRFLSIAILQHRRVSINTRLMLLGLFLERIDQEMGQDTFCDIRALQPVMEEYLQSLQYAGEIQAKLLESMPNQMFKLKIIGGILTGSLANGAKPRLAGCLLDALDTFHGEGDVSDDAAIVARYEAAYSDYYKPFYSGREHIVENYLVSEAFRRMFPIIAASAMEAYRELVCNYAIIRFVLIGMAGKHKGLTEALVVKLIQSFTEKSGHDRAYMPKLLQRLQEENSESLMHMMWLLREHDE